MSTALTITAPAKLNLFLHITGRRSDGYHTLQTLFQLLDWGDTLHFSPNDSGELTLAGPDMGFDPADNLILRAARAGSSVASTDALCVCVFHELSSGRNVTQGLNISTKENPGWRTASIIVWVVALMLPENERATKLAPDARAMTSG